MGLLKSVDKMEAGFRVLLSDRARAVAAAASAELVRIFMYDRSEHREDRLFDGRQRLREAREALAVALEREAQERTFGRHHHSAACG
jgi:hypothetical protein